MFPAQGSRTPRSSQLAQRLQDSRAWHIRQKFILAPGAVEPHMLCDVMKCVSHHLAAVMPQQDRHHRLDDRPSPAPGGLLSPHANDSGAPLRCHGTVAQRRDRFSATRQPPACVDYGMHQGGASHDRAGQNAPKHLDILFSRRRQGPLPARRPAALVTPRHRRCAGRRRGRSTHPTCSAGSPAASCPPPRYR